MGGERRCVALIVRSIGRCFHHSPKRKRGLFDAITPTEPSLTLRAKKRGKHHQLAAGSSILLGSALAAREGIKLFPGQSPSFDFVGAVPDQVALAHAQLAKLFTIAVYAKDDVGMRE